MRSFARLALGIAAAAAIGVAFSSTATAAVVFKSGAYVSGNQSLVGVPTAPTLTADVPASWDLAYGVRTPASGYTGPVISGGWKATITCASNAQSITPSLGTPTARVENNFIGPTADLTDGVRIGLARASGTVGSVSTTIAFAGGFVFSTETVDLSAIDTASYGVRFAHTPGASQTSRLLVRAADGTLYVSQSMLTGTGADSGNTLVPPTANVIFSGEQWAEVSTSDFTFGEFSAPAFTSITGMGWYGAGSSTANTSDGNQILRAAIGRVEYTLIPEPAALGLLGLVALAGLARRR